MTIRRSTAFFAAAALLAGVSGLSPSVTAVEGAGDVTGVVLTPDGGPQAGATVSLLSLVDGSTTTTGTAADGTFAFTGGVRPSLFAVEVCGTPHACANIIDATDVVKTYVGPAQAAYSLPALTAYYSTATNSPAVNVGPIQLVRPATLTVKDLTGDPHNDRTRIDVSGIRLGWAKVSTFTGLAPGTHRVQVDGQEQQVTLTAGASSTVVFDQPLPAVTGRVKVDGEPLAHAPLTLTEPGDCCFVAETKTDAHGRYRLGGLNLSDAGYVLRLGTHYTTSNDLRGVQHVPKVIRSVPADHAGQVTHLDLTAHRASLGNVLVTIPTPALALAGVYSSDGELVAQLGSKGGVLTGLPTGVYTVAASFGYTSNRRTAWSKVRVRQGRTTAVTLKRQHGQASLHIAATPKAQVMVVAAFPGPATSSLRALASLVLTRDVPAGGYVDVSDLPSGRYVVSLLHTDAAWDETALVEPDPVGATLTDGAVDVVLDPPQQGGVLKGRFVDASSGQPWPWTPVITPSLACVNGRTFVNDLVTSGTPPVVVNLLTTGAYTCSIQNFWLDRGTPYGAGSHVRPVLGPYPVTVGQTTEVDLPVAFGD